MRAGTGMAEVFPVFPSSCSRVATTRAFGAMSISLRMYRLRWVTRPWSMPMGHSKEHRRQAVQW